MKQELDVKLEVTLAIEHRLVQQLGWDSAWIGSVLPRTEKRLRQRRFQRALDVIDGLWDNKFCASVMDVVLVALRPQFREKAQAFYNGGKRLAELLPPAELHRLDADLDRAVCRITYEYERAIRSTPDAAVRKSAVRATIGALGLVPPQAPNPVLIPPTAVAIASPGASAGVDQTEDAPDAPKPPWTGKRFFRTLDRLAIFDCEQGLLWDASPPLALHTLAEARQIAARASSRVRWRLPTREELWSLTDAREHALRAFEDVRTGWFWSSSFAGRINDRWIASFSDSLREKLADPTEQHRVMLVSDDAP